jgi:hypothetical protein
MSQYLPRYSNVNNIDNDLTRQGWNMRSRGKSDTIDILERDNIYKKAPQYVPRDLYNTGTGNPNPNNSNNPILKKPSFDDLLSQYSADSSSTTSSTSIGSTNQKHPGINHTNLNNSDINVRNSELKQFDEVNRLNIEIDGYKKEIIAYKGKMKLIRDKDIDLQKANMEVEKYKRLFVRIPELEKEIKDLQLKLVDSELKLTTHKNKEFELSVLNDAVSKHDKSVKSIKSQHVANYNALNSKCNNYMKINAELNTKLGNLKNKHAKLESDNAILNSRFIEITGKNAELNKQIKQIPKKNNNNNNNNGSDNITNRLKNIDIEHVPVPVPVPVPVGSDFPIEVHIASIKTIIKSRLNLDVSESDINTIINKENHIFSKETLRQNINDLIVSINKTYNPILNVDNGAVPIDNLPIDIESIDNADADTDADADADANTDANTDTLIISSADRDKNKYRSPFNFVCDFNKSVSYIAINHIKIPSHLENETLYLNIPEIGANKVLLDNDLDKEIQYENKTPITSKKLSISFTLDNKLIMDEEGDEVKFTINYKVK